MSLSNEYVTLASARVVDSCKFDTNSYFSSPLTMSIVGNYLSSHTDGTDEILIGLYKGSAWTGIGRGSKYVMYWNSSSIGTSLVRSDFKEEGTFSIDITAVTRASYSAYGISTGDIFRSSQVPTSSIALFGLISGRYTKEFRFVSSTLIHSGTTTHHYVPVQNKNDGVIYIYDTITDTIGSVSGTPLEITPQAINSNPESRGYIFTDTPHSINCGVTYEYGDISYQWQVSEDNTTFTNIQDATASSYTPTKVLGSRYYKCVTTLSSYGKTAVMETSVATITFYKIDTDNLIYDRTQADIDRLYALKSKMETATATAEEIAEWTSGMRAALNYTDMNRINEALYQAKNMCEVTSISVTYPYELKRDYVMSDTITSTTFTNLLANVTALKTALQTWILTPVPAGMKTITDVNAVEYILSQVEDIIKNIRSAFRYSAEMHAGEQY